MSDKLGFVNYAGVDNREYFMPEKDYSDTTARIIDEEIKSIIDAAYNDTQRLIDQHWDKTVAIAEALLKYETLQGEDVKRLMRGESLGKPTVSELLQAAANAAHGKTAAPESNRPAPGGKQREFEGPGEGVMPSPA